MSCVFCGNVCQHGIELSDGNTIHDQCFAQATNDVRKIKDTIEKIQKELNFKKLLLTKIVMFFLGNNGPTERQLSNELISLNEEYKTLNVKITYVNDFMLSYPIDWRDRCRRVRDIYGDKCAICGSINNLQVHHKIPLSKGGSNKISNLLLRCENCHLQEHHKESFGEKFIVRLSIQDKIKILTEAINNHNRIQFFYKKPTDQVAIKRIVLPQSFSKVYHRTNRANFTLCLVGFCYIRNDVRKFAIKRMTNIQII